MTKRSPRIGFIVATSHTGVYDELGKPLPVMGMAEKARRALTENRIETVTFRNKSLIDGEVKDDQVEQYDKDAIVDSRKKSFEMVDQFKSENLDCIVCFLPTWFWVHNYTQALLELNLPVLTWVGDDIRGCQGIGLWSMRGTLDALDMLIHKELYGRPENENIVKQAVDFCKAAMVKNILRRSVFGQFGSMPIGMLPGVLEDIEWLRTFGVQAEHLESLILPIEGEKAKLEELKAVYSRLKESVGGIAEFENDVVQKNLRVYIALRKISEEMGLDFTGVKCTMELSDNYCSPCIAQSLINSEGFVSGCTTEPKGSLTMYIMSLLSDKPIFQGDIEGVDRETNMVHMVSCGAAPFGFVDEKKDFKFVKRAELEGSAEAISASVVGKKGKITFARLARVKDNYVMQIASGDVIVDPKEKENREKLGWPSMPFAAIKLNGDPDAFINELRSQYMHIIYDDIVDELIAVCNVLQIEARVS